MRLLNIKTFSLESFEGSEKPSYAILSHRWQDEEVLFQDIEKGTARGREGWAKLEMACSKASDNDLNYVWIDTCCIDKSSSSELSEAINSMFRWYVEAKLCFVYLYDVKKKNISESAWFSRGWTLQELIAPKHQLFFDRRWRYIGTKQDMSVELSKITRIPELLLLPPMYVNKEWSSHIQMTLENQPIQVKMSWAAHRKTTRVEDMAYCLMGLFDVHMPMLYGEGQAAFRRLQEEIIRRSTDASFLLFEYPESRDRYPIFGRDPSSFAIDTPKSQQETQNQSWVYTLSKSSAPLRSWYTRDQSAPFSLTNAGLSVQLKLLPYTIDIYLALIDSCVWWQKAVSFTRLLMPCIYLRRIHGTQCFVRTKYNHKGAGTIHGRIQPGRLSPDQPEFEEDHPSGKYVHQLLTSSWVLLDRAHDNLHLADTWGQGHGVKLEFCHNQIWGSSGIPSLDNIIGYSVRALKSTSFWVESLPGVEHIFCVIKTQMFTELDPYALYLHFDEEFGLHCTISNSKKLSTYVERLSSQMYRMPMPNRITFDDGYTFENQFGITAQDRSGEVESLNLKISRGGGFVEIGEMGRFQSCLTLRLEPIEIYDQINEAITRYHNTVTKMDFPERTSDGVLVPSDPGAERRFLTWISVPSGVREKVYWYDCGSAAPTSTGQASSQ